MVLNLNYEPSRCSRGGSPAASAAEGRRKRPEADPASAGLAASAAEGRMKRPEADPASAGLGRKGLAGDALEEAAQPPCWQLSRTPRISPQTNTYLFCALCPQLYAPGKDFSVGHPSLQVKHA
jgi:hypothetical protein